MNTPSINTHILLGRGSDEPVMRFTQSGTAKLSFKLTTDRPQPGGHVFSDYHKVVCWAQQLRLLKNQQNNFLKIKIHKEQHNLQLMQICFQH